MIEYYVDKSMIGNFQRFGISVFVMKLSAGVLGNLKRNYKIY